VVALAVEDFKYFGRALGCYDGKHYSFKASQKPKPIHGFMLYEQRMLNPRGINPSQINIIPNYIHIKLPIQINHNT
jgi:hypothetical protein